VDALLLSDSLHAGYLDNKTVDPRKLEPFVRFARTAMEGRKLLVLTHSAIETDGYASTTKTSNALLDAVGGKRIEVDPAEASPPKVNMEVALKAMPASTRRWLESRSECHVGDFHVLGFTGQTPEDHMAHLVQMSVTLLPYLGKRWK
jgi:hypothetical protein